MVYECLEARNASVRKKKVHVGALSQGGGDTLTGWPGAQSLGEPEGGGLSRAETKEDLLLCRWS